MSARISANPFPLSVMATAPTDVVLMRFCVWTTPTVLVVAICPTRLLSMLLRHLIQGQRRSGENQQRRA
jgi:hypothetical protein